uniref:Chromosome 11 open reading frame 16 n=1 Tax=Gopherus evgoodei TaxID=1825980 RepID=A0A8C4VXH4_9SAUR
MSLLRITKVWAEMTPVCSLYSSHSAASMPPLLCLLFLMSDFLVAILVCKRDCWLVESGACPLFRNQGRTFLVEFDKPLASGDKYSVCVQKTARDDILEYVNGMRHSILPGDKVLAPWEPDLVRYGPGTILLGIETRDPLRASEDEEIMVCFWNDKKVKVPLGVALWIPPDTWERIVEMIHMPFTSRLKLTNPLTTTSSYTSTCRLLKAPIHSCALDDGLSKYRWPWPWLWPFICPPFHGHCHSICCSPVHVGCICCSHPKFSAWRPLLSTSLLPQRSTKQQESNNKPTAQLLELESPKENEPAAAATIASSSSSSSSSSSDLGSEEEMGLTKSTVVDSAVNTDSSLFKKPKLKDAARPEWKYWKRNHAKYTCKCLTYLISALVDKVCMMHRKQKTNLTICH